MNISQHKLTESEIRTLFIGNGDYYYLPQSRTIALHACIGNPEAPIEVILTGCSSKNRDVRKIAYAACANKVDIPTDVLESGISDTDPVVRYNAIVACANRKDISTNLLCAAMDDDDQDIRYAAIRASEGRLDVPVDVICCHMLNDNYSDVRLASAIALYGRPDVPATDILKCIRTTDPGNFAILHQLFELCKGRSDIDKETIIKYGFESLNEYVRVGALIATIGRDDMQEDVREYFKNGFVYVECENNVAVKAYIPAYANCEYSGDSQKYNMAVVTEVNGSICGLNIGIPKNNHGIAYRVGDVINSFNPGFTIKCEL